jgi:hypothetical protein
MKSVVVFISFHFLPLCIYPMSSKHLSFVSRGWLLLFSSFKKDNVGAYM